MSSPNGTTPVEPSPRMFEDQFESLKANVKKWIDRVSIKPSGEPSRLSRFAAKTSELVKAHPILALGVALGSGYMVMRIVRRR